MYLMKLLDMQEIIKNIITPVKFDNSSVEFILESENDLGDNPSLRPLLLLSKLLLDIEGLNEYYINKRFLKILVSKKNIY